MGTHGIYDVRGISAEKGRHVIRPEVMAGIPAAMLATDLAFGSLGLSELRAASVSTNLPVHSLHRKCGFKQTGTRRAAQTIDGQSVDLEQFLLMPEDWAKARERLLPLAQFAGKHIQEWERQQSYNGDLPPFCKVSQRNKCEIRTRI